MGFGEAYINLQLLYQNYFTSAVYYDEESAQIIANPKLKKRWKMFSWNLTEFRVLISVLYCIYRINRMIREYERSGTIDPEEIVIYFGASGAILQALATFYHIEQDPTEVIYIGSQILQLNGIKNRGWPTSTRLPDTQELIGYGLAIVFFNFPIIAFVIPWIMMVDLINTHLVDIIPDIPRKLMASFSYSILIFFGANICSTFLLLIASCCQDRHVKREQSKTSTFEGEILMDRHSAIDLNDNFKRRRKLYLQLRLLMEQSNRLAVVFIPTMAGVGMLLCVILNYALITFSGKEGLLFAWSLAAIVLEGKVEGEMGTEAGSLHASNWVHDWAVLLGKTGYSIGDE
ncbi:unnamed protein product [Orchesella dallaii]|uniref:Odorant receptor n=1 Tax=Orchesella dallaii TaxID=48710 RepID=A0ABP1S8L5_9HEXA